MRNLAFPERGNGCGATLPIANVGFGPTSNRYGSKGGSQGDPSPSLT